MNPLSSTQFFGQPISLPITASTVPATTPLKLPQEDPATKEALKAKISTKRPRDSVPLSNNANLLNLSSQPTVYNMPPLPPFPQSTLPMYSSFPHTAHHLMLFPPLPPLPPLLPPLPPFPRSTLPILHTHHSAVASMPPLPPFPAPEFPIYSSDSVLLTQEVALPIFTHYPSPTSASPLSASPATIPAESDSNEERAPKKLRLQSPNVEQEVVRKQVSASLSASSVPTTGIEAQVKTLSENVSSDNLPWFDSLSQFSKLMDATGGNQTFEARIQALQKLMGEVRSQAGQIQGHSAWITMHEDADPAKSVYLKVIIKPSKYFSKAFDPVCFPQSSRSQNYDLSFFESIGQNGDIDLQAPLLRVRASESSGELVWLSAGKKVSGSNMGDVYLTLEPMLGIDMYLFDDAKVVMEAIKEKGRSKKIAKIWLKASHGIGRPDGKTFYQRKLGFKVAKCVKWKMGCTEDPSEQAQKKIKEEINQDPVKYHAALTIVRTTKLSELKTFSSKYKVIAKKLEEIAQRVFGQQNVSNFDLSNCNKTVHQLESALIQQLQNAKNPSEKAQAQMDQYYVHSNVYYPYEIQSKMEKEEEQFWASMLTLINTTVFKKSPNRATK